MERLKKDLEDETTKSHEIEEQLRQIVDNGNEQRTHMDNVNTRVRDFRQKKSDIAAQKTFVKICFSNTINSQGIFLVN